MRISAPKASKSLLQTFTSGKNIKTFSSTGIVSGLKIDLNGTAPSILPFGEERGPWENTDRHLCCATSPNEIDKAPQSGPVVTPSPSAWNNKSILLTVRSLVGDFEFDIFRQAMQMLRETQAAAFDEGIHERCAEVTEKLLEAILHSVRLSNLSIAELERRHSLLCCLVDSYFPLKARAAAKKAFEAEYAKLSSKVQMISAAKEAEDFISSLESQNGQLL